MAVPLVWALATIPWWHFLIVATLVTAIGIWAAHRSDLAWGTHDSGRIVIDEVAGYMITMIPVARDSAATLGIGFVVFRVLDIVKPPPVRWIDDHLPGGWGVMLDDVAAGLLGAGVMAALGHFGAIDWVARTIVPG